MNVGGILSKSVLHLYQCSNEKGTFSSFSSSLCTWNLKWKSLDIYCHCIMENSVRNSIMFFSRERKSLLIYNISWRNTNNLARPLPLSPSWGSMVISQAISVYVLKKVCVPVTWMNNGGDALTPNEMQHWSVWHEAGATMLMPPLQLWGLKGLLFSLFRQFINNQGTAQLVSTLHGHFHAVFLQTNLDHLVAFSTAQPGCQFLAWLQYCCLLTEGCCWDKHDWKVMDNKDALFYRILSGDPPVSWEVLFLSRQKLLHWLIEGGVLHDDGCEKMTHQNKTARPVSSLGERGEEQTTCDNVSHAT